MQSWTDLMRQKYAEHLASKPAVLGVEVAALIAKASPVFDFMQQYMDGNRPSQISHSADRNYLITLADQTQFAMATDLGSGDDLPDSGAMQVIGHPRNRT